MNQMNRVIHDSVSLTTIHLISRKITKSRKNITIHLISHKNFQKIEKKGNGSEASWRRRRRIVENA